MENEAGIYRPELSIDGNFTIVPNAWLREETLGPAAKLLLIYLVSHQVGYEVRDPQIMKETGLGRHALRSARAELEQAGWLKLQRIRHEDNTLGGYRYELQEARGYFSTVESSTVESSTVENRPHNRKPSNKKTKSKKTNKGETTPKRPHRLPDDWFPSDRLLEMFATKWPSLEPEWETENFINYWIGSGKPKADWDRTFQGWMNRNERDNQNRIGRKSQPKLSNAERAALLVQELEKRQQAEPGGYTFELDMKSDTK